MGNTDGCAFFKVQLMERLLAQAQLLRGDDLRIVHHVEHGLDFLRPAVALHLDLGQGLEARRAVDVAFPVQVHHVLAVGVDADLAQLERDLT
jgi:hypothetical protein